MSGHSVASGARLHEPAPAGLSGRVLGFWSLLALGINGIVGVGIFFAPAELARQVPGAGSALAFAITAVSLAPVAWVFGRLGSAYAGDGGPYVWAREAFGERLAFGIGFVAYTSALLSTSAVVSGLGQYLAPELGFRSGATQLGFQLILAVGLSGVASLGLRVSAWVWSFLTVLKLAPLLWLVACALPALRAEPATPVDAFDGASFSSWGRAALIAVFPLQGFEIVPVPSAEVRGERRSVLAATLLSLGLAALLFVLLQLACVLGLPALSRSEAPIVEAGAHYAGAGASPVFSGATSLSAIGIAFGMFAMTPRYLSALGTPALLGSALSRETRGVPLLSLAVTALGVILLVSSSSLSALFVLSSLAVLLQYAVSALSLFWLALRRERGFGSLDQWLSSLTLLSIAMLALAAELQEIVVLAGILLGGFGLLYARRRLSPASRPDPVAQTSTRSLSSLDP